MVVFNEKTRKTSFQLNLPDANTVSVLGSFNDWDPKKNIMKKGKDGTWKSEIRLAPGEYQFLYFADQSRWLTDENCPHTTSEVGTENSVCVIPPVVNKKKTEPVKAKGKKKGKE